MARKQTVNAYSLPVNVVSVSAVVKDSPSHEGPYKGSIDYAVPIDTNVFAGADGVVSRIEQGSQSYGDSPEFGQLVNYISISHANKEISEYLHLARNSAKVKVGDVVKKGQVISKTGLSGWMTAPHLHFMVYKAAKESKEFSCLDIKFDK